MVGTKQEFWCGRGIREYYSTNLVNGLVKSMNAIYCEDKLGKHSKLQTSMR